MTPSRTPPRRWLGSLAAALALHGVVGGAYLALDPLSPELPSRSEDAILRFVFPPDPLPAFAEQPEDREETTAPERPEARSNVTARARDRAPGGSEERPRSRGVIEAPSLSMEERQASPAPTPEPRAVPEPAAESPGAGAPSATDAVSPVITRGRLLQRPGARDLRQPPRESPERNAPLSGEITLSTTAWDFAPWLMRFRRDVMRNWFAPPAFWLGLIHGHTLLELEIAPTGEMLRLEILEEKGGDALTTSSRGAFTSAAPFRPLPADFPEETLVLRVRMIYSQRPR